MPCCLVILLKSFSIFAFQLKYKVHFLLKSYQSQLILPKFIFFANITSRKETDEGFSLVVEIAHQNKRKSKTISSCNKICSYEVDLLFYHRAL